ncbi:hypothetical protein B0H13DRAFT_2098757 [Mycena leptocephala]|nr:hypothetical protein B0H13DRAFT_2098757 [Mycena leptocephala]
MQFKFVWLPLVILAGASSVYGSALEIVQDRDLAIAGDLASRDDVQCNWCDCFTALAAEGVACAAAILEVGCSDFHIKTPPPVTPPTSPQCCSSVVSSSSSAASSVAFILGLDLTGIDVPVGLSCSPITVIGNNCGSTTVTCDAPEAEWGGLIAINCIPITA